jgi:predicted dehydrogenase
MFTGAKGEVKLITLDPGHFHAALVQKTMYATVDSVVYVYTPEGQDVMDHLARIEGFNNRQENPTSWIEKTYTGTDFFERMLREKPGNVVVISGNNARKTEYILESVKAGIHVLADKPMVITYEDFILLEEAFMAAEENGVLLYDIMTERYEITTILQREFSMIPEVFGEIVEGTPDDPAITKESVHHFYKYVSGVPLIRSAWFFDIRQQGEGIVDVSTHLVDLIQWEAFPGQTLDRTDVEMISAKRWTTDLTPEQFGRVTGMKDYPEYLKDYIDYDTLKVYSNGEMIYKLKGVHAKVSVVWNFQAPEGAGDTHYSIMRGTRCNLVIRQGPDENYQPVLYIELPQESIPETFEKDLNIKFTEVAEKYPGITLEKLDESTWKIFIPDSYKVGHEAHFGQVTEKFLQYLQDGKLPDWEVPNMITKYYTATQALEIASQKK